MNKLSMYCLKTVKFISEGLAILLFFYAIAVWESELIWFVYAALCFALSILVKKIGGFDE